jgi:septum site-determining protein MinC
VVNLPENKRDREIALLLDVSKAGNSAQACQLADEFVARIAEGPAGTLVDINAGDLLLTRGVLTKLKQQIQRAGATLGTMYATVPQTQQAALDEGLFVKEKLVTEWTPIRQPLPLQSAKSKMATPPAATAKKSEADAEKAASKSGVSLPDFSQPRPSMAAHSPVEDFEPVAPQSLEVPELAAPEVEEMAVVETSEMIMELDVEADETEAVELPQEVVYPDAGFETLYLKQNLRSGQTVKFNGNIIIIGDVHAGSEITAGGDIVVWGELRGIAHAGAQGNYKSEIRAMKIEALQLRIADYIARRPDRIYYHKEGSDLTPAPELARVADGEIKIFKTMLPRG